MEFTRYELILLFNGMDDVAEKMKEKGLRISADYENILVKLNDELERLKNE